jgi:FG-GAP repeat protein
MAGVALTVAATTMATSDVELQSVAVTGALPSDFNGDGVEDVAVGVPGDSPYDWQDAGGVNVRYGMGTDGSRLPSRFFSVESPGIAPLLRQYPTGLGRRIASGDFDRDGFADLAMSVPGFDEPDPDLQRINVGGVVVVYGTASGLMPGGSQHAQVWSQDSPGVQGVSEDDDAFGSSLAVGDFDGDQFLDLAIGAAGEMSGPGLRNSGSLTVLYGGRAGLTGRDQVVTQDSRGILDASEAGDWAAGALAAGDFDGDGVDDLAMGVSSEDIEGRVNVGAVNVVYGTRGTGLNGVGDRFVHQGLEAIPGVPRRGDGFGDVLAVGDFNGDRRDDLAVGAPYEAAGGWPQAGTVTTILGTSNGLAFVTAQAVTLASATPFAEPAYAWFGGALATGDLDADGYDELAVGAPGHLDRGGRVDVLRGGVTGLEARATQSLVSSDLDTPGLVAGQETLGNALQFGHFDATLGADLLIGASRADLRIDGLRHDQAGAVAMAFSRSGLLNTADTRWLHQGAPTVPGTADAWETFGAALPGSQDFNG